jgi:ABC-type multidrug transport system ATPase subunit
MDLQIRGISKTYANGVEALRDVTLAIPEGMCGLLGPNGAGKSTLMRILATLQEPDEGSVHLGDIDVLEEKDEVRRTLGYLPQEFGVHPRRRCRWTSGLRSACSEYLSGRSAATMLDLYRESGQGAGSLDPAALEEARLARNSCISVLCYLAS